VVSASPAAPPVGSAEPPAAPNPVRLLWSRTGTLCWVELAKIRHDRSELYTRAIQPALWLLIFGETFTRIHAIPTGRLSYLDYLAPGIMAQSALFIAIFYGIQLIWERDFGILTKLLVTPTLLLGLPSNLLVDFGVLLLAAAAGIVAASSLLGRLAR
jgi:ABC-2 type transport system permease protein